MLIPLTLQVCPFWAVPFPSTRMILNALPRSYTPNSANAGILELSRGPEGMDVRLFGPPIPSSSDSTLPQSTEAASVKMLMVMNMACVKKTLFRAMEI